MKTIVKKVKDLYDDKILPIVVEKACSLDSVSEQRKLVVPKASGVVLEIGIGTGLNANFYDKEKVTQIIGVDPNLQPQAQQRFDTAGIELISQPLSAEKLPLDDNSVNSIVMTFTLCTIPDPVQALTEMARVLKPSGTLYYAEHGLVQNSEAVNDKVHKVVSTIQQTITPAWKPISGGCCLDRDISGLIEQAGFTVTGMHGFTNGTSIVGYHYWGEAVVR